MSSSELWLVDESGAFLFDLHTLLACSAPDRAFRVRTIVLCSWASHFTLAMPLSTQGYKWVPVNFSTVGGTLAVD